MVKKIYIFSGTKNLFNTVIKHEINDLIRKHDVYVFKEYENISISKNNQAYKLAWQKPKQIKQHIAKNKKCLYY